MILSVVIPLKEYTNVKQVEKNGNDWKQVKIFFLMFNLNFYRKNILRLIKCFFFLLCLAQKRTLIDDVDQKFDELQELVSIMGYFFLNCCSTIFRLFY